MARTTCVIVAFVLAAAAVSQAHPCSSGIECPSDIKPSNVASLLETKVPTTEAPTTEALMQASQCSNGGECPSGGDTQNIVSLLQSTLQMNVLKGGGEQKVMLPAACAERKLVINSHVKYTTALDRLVASLKKYKFPLHDCVVFRGGASIGDVSEPRIGRDGMTFVDLPLNNYDLNAYAGLARYHNHSLVCADMYFYIHDSTQIGARFPQIFKTINVSPTDLITPGNRLFSNICVFGRSVVDKFGDDFEGEIGKGQGFQIEMDGCSHNLKACSISHYAGTQTVIPDRVFLGTVDVYNTSKPRCVTWYQDWDIYKFFLWQNKSALQTDLALVQDPPEVLKCPKPPDYGQWAWAVDAELDGAAVSE